MMPKKIFNLFLILSAILFSFTAKSSYKEGLLWEIESTSGQKSVIFGTMHYIDDRVFHVFENVKQYMLDANSISVEYVPKNEDESALEKLLFKTDIHIRDYFNVAEYEKFLNLIKLKNISLEEIEYSSPFHIFNLIICPTGHTMDLHMDAQITVYAMKNGIPLNGLEDTKSIMEIMTDFDNSYTINEIKKIIHDPSMISTHIEEVIKLYLKENLSGMHDLIKSSAPIEFFEQVVVHRNKMMFNALIKIIDNGDAFIAVGAAHLGEDEGLLNLLSQSGYKVSQIPFLHPLS